MWFPMETAPRDGTPIQAKIPGNGSDNIIRWMCIDDGEVICTEYGKPAVNKNQEQLI